MGENYNNNNNDEDYKKKKTINNYPKFIISWV